MVLPVILTADIQSYMQAPIYQPLICDAKLLQVCQLYMMPASPTITSTKQVISRHIDIKPQVFQTWYQVQLWLILVACDTQAAKQIKQT